MTVRTFARVCVAACAMWVTVSAQGRFSPARYSGGVLPVMPTVAVGPGQVFVELEVSNVGRVTSVKALRTTPPYTDMVVAAVKAWQFSPAEVELEREPGQSTGAPRRQSVPSKVLVAGVFRPSSFSTPTQGELPRDVASESDETPFPVTATQPTFPPLTRDPGVALVEVQVGLTGSVTSATIVRSAPGFDEVALAAARQFAFRPARVRGQTVVTRAYLIFGFPWAFGTPKQGRG